MYWKVLSGALLNEVLVTICIYKRKVAAENINGLVFEMHMLMSETYNKERGNNSLLNSYLLMCGYIVALRNKIIITNSIDNLTKWKRNIGCGNMTNAVQQWPNLILR